MVNIKGEIRSEVERIAEHCSSDTVEKLTEIIYDVAFDNVTDVSDVFTCLIEDGLEIEFGGLINVVLHFLAKNEVGTNKLFRFFVDSCEDLSVFVELVNVRRKYLSDSQYQTLKQRSNCFDSEILQRVCPVLFAD